MTHMFIPLSLSPTPASESQLVAKTLHLVSNSISLQQVPN